MQLLVDIPNDKAYSEKFPPSCKVLLISGGEISTTPAVVIGVKLDLASSDRRSLFVLEGRDEPLPSENLLFCPECPVWVDVNGSKVKGIVRSAFYPLNISEAVYQIQMESGIFIGVSTTMVSFCSEDVHISAPAKAEPIELDKTSVVVPKQQQQTIVSPEELPSSEMCEPVESMAVKHEAISTKRRNQEAPTSTYLNLPSWLLTREQVVDVIDDDFVKELKYNTNCSSIFIAKTGEEGDLRICITSSSSDQANVEDAMRQLKDSVLECVEDHERDRLYDAIDRLNTASEGPAKKPRLLQVMAPTEPVALHSANTPPTSPKANSGEQQQQQDATVDPHCRTIHVPAWVGNLKTIKEDVQQAGPWMEQSLSCKIEIIESTSSELLVCVKGFYNLDDAQLTVENLILRGIDRKLWGRILHHFATEMIGTSVDSMHVLPLPQRDPSNIQGLVHGAVIWLPTGCSKSALSERDLVDQVAALSGCNVNVVGIDECVDPFIFVSGTEDSIRQGCSLILEKIAKLGFQAPSMGSAPSVDDDVSRGDISSSSLESQEDIGPMAKRDGSKYAAEAPAIGSRPKLVPNPRRQPTTSSMEIQIPEWTGRLIGKKKRLNPRL